MNKKRIFAAVALTALIALSSGSYVLAESKQKPATAQLDVTADNSRTEVAGDKSVAGADTNDLYKQCLEIMPKEADLESWHNSPDHQKLHQDMMADKSGRQTMHKKMMGTNIDIKATHNAHHE